MHHLFYIENGISLAIAHRYIYEKQIPKEKVILFSGRNVKVNSDFDNIDLTSCDFKVSWFFPLGWVKTFKVKRRINHILSTRNISTFNFYSSSISKLVCYFLIQKKELNRFFNVEDGRGAFYSKDEFKKYINKFHFANNAYRFYQVKCWVNYFFLHYPNPNKTIDSLIKNNNAIVSSERAFQYVENKYIVKGLFKSPVKDYSEVKCLMSLSYPVEDGLIDLTNYLKVLNDTFDKLIEMNLNTVHYKFHPQQFNYPENIKEYNNVLLKYSNSINFVLLDNSEILEEVIANSNAVLLSDYSSIMIYTKGLGNRIISNFNLIEKYKSKDQELPNFPKVLEQIIVESHI